MIKKAHDSGEEVDVEAIVQAAVQVDGDSLQCQKKRMEQETELLGEMTSIIVTEAELRQRYEVAMDVREEFEMKKQKIPDNIIALLDV
jgi:hypothetical protein